MYQIKIKDNVLEETQEAAVSQIADTGYLISLENGSYQVRIYAGDINHEGDVNVYTKINGVDMPPVWMNDKTVKEAVFEAEVTDGKLELLFYGKYVRIQGIDVAKKVTVVPSGIEEKHIASLEKSSVVVGWDCEGDDFHLYKKVIDRPDIPEQCIEVKGHAYFDDEVELCRTYQYQVCAVNVLDFEGERSEPIQLQVVEGSKFKLYPFDFHVKEVTDDAVHLSWDFEEGIRQYVLYRRSAGNAWKEIARVDAHTLEYVDEIPTDREYEYAMETESLGGISNKTVVKARVHRLRRRRQAEELNRGLVAVVVTEEETGENGVFVSWRLQAYEYAANVAFNLYADGVKLNETPILGATNYFHAAGTKTTVYEVRKVVDGKEEAEKCKKPGNVAKPLLHNYMELPLDKPAPYTTPDGQTYPYTANDAGAADLDGDGEYEIILKWDCNGKDNSHKGYSGEVLIDAYKLDGTKLWRIALGPNIRCGAHYTQFLVYDFDGDGYAEMICKTADGTVDGQGKVIGNPDADYRNSEGFILEGPEFLTVFDGRTGAAVDTVPYDPPRGNMMEYGDSWGNRCDRFLACVAYLDGEHPSAVMCRGYYDYGCLTNLVAYDLTDKKLVKRWKFRADKNQNISYTNQGFHNLAVADVDGDGCDEILYGGCVIDHDGTGLYSTGLGHGDAMHVGRFSPDSIGYDFYGVHEHRDCPYGMEARDAGTGEIKFGKYTGCDTGRGLTAKIDPRYRGNQIWAYEGAGLYNFADGTLISDKSPASINFAIWWDGDLLRELCDHYWSGYEENISIGRIYKWNWETEELEIILDSVDCPANNGSKGNPCLQASLFGDWREEVIWRNQDSTHLRIYTTTDLTEHRFYTFMHDPVYRLGIAWQNTAYNQPPHTSFYIGDDMKEIPVPELTYISS